MGDTRRVVLLDLINRVSEMNSLTVLNASPANKELLDLELCCNNIVAMLEAQAKKGVIPHYHDILVGRSILNELQAIPVAIRSTDRGHWVSELTSVLEFAQVATAQAFEHTSKR